MENKNHYLEVCSQPWDTLVISTEGDAFACSAGYYIGNISDPNFWNSDKAVELRNNLLSKKAQGVCVKCPFYKIHTNSEFSSSPKRGEEYNNCISEHPKRIELYTTEKCNLKCFMCSIDSRHNGCQSKSLSKDKLVYLAEKYFDKLESLNSNCGGEIFLYEHFDTLLDLLEKHRPGHVNINTSGSLKISEDVWRRIAKTHDLISFSVDASTPLTHRIIRGFDFQRLIDNINIVKKIKKETNKKIRIGFNYICMKLNVEEIFPFVEKAYYEWDADTITFMHVTGERNKQQSIFEDDDCIEKYNKQVKMVNDFICDKKIIINDLKDIHVDKNANIVKERDNILRRIGDSAILNASCIGKKNDCKKIFKFSHYDKFDFGNILYFMDSVKDPVMAFIKEGEDLVINYHNGEDWTKVKTNIKLEKTSSFRINGWKISDIYIDEKRLVDIVKECEDISLVYNKVSYFETDNPKFPDTEPEISKMEKFNIVENKG